MKKRKQHLQLLVAEFSQSVLQMASSTDPKNINQVISLIKANIRVLENDVKICFSKHESQDFDYKEYN